MIATRRRPLALVIVAGFIAITGAGRASALQQPTAPEAATLYVFNDSGRTLFPGKQKLAANGRTLVNLPRHTYQRVSLPPGAYELRFPTLKKPMVQLTTEAGRSYYVVVAYRPERAYGGPFTGSSSVLIEITEEEALGLMERMTELTNP